MKRSLIFIFAVVIIAAFHPANALQCFNKEKDRLCSDHVNGEVVECLGSNPGCSISETFMSLGSLGAIKKCSRSCLDDLNSSNEGCFFNNLDGGYVRICNCGSDECNENFDTAGRLYPLSKHILQ